MTCYKTYPIILMVCLMSMIPCSIQANTIVLLDMSGSMKEELGAGQPKYQEAFRVIRDVVIPDLAKANQAAGLWSFGGYCSQFRYQGRITQGASSFNQDLNNLGYPDGSTPLAWSIRQAINELSRQAEPKHLIVVTDGIESCKGDPCAEVTTGRAQQMKISIHTVGLGMRSTSNAFKVLECIAAKTGGQAVAIDRPGDSIPQVQDTMNNAFKKVTDNITQQGGELVVTVINAQGRNTPNVNYSVQSSGTGQQEKQGKSGTPLSLPPGKYQVVLKQQTRSVEIAPGSRQMIEFKMDLGHLKAFSTCGDPNMSFSILDAQKNTIASASISEGVDLPPGTYNLMILNYPYLPPKQVVVTNNQVTSVQLGSFGEIEILAQNAAGQSVHLPLEIFDDAAQYGTMPVATGETNNVFSLPVGTYNVRVSPEHPMFNQMQGGANIQVAECQKNMQVQLTQTAAIYVTSSMSGSITAYNDSTGESITGMTGEMIGVQAGTYNVLCPNGEIMPNIVVTTGKVDVTCP